MSARPDGMGGPTFGGIRRECARPDGSSRHIRRVIGMKNYMSLGCVLAVLLVATTLGHAEVPLPEDTRRLLRQVQAFETNWRPSPVNGRVIGAGYWRQH